MASEAGVAAAAAGVAGREAVIGVAEKKGKKIIGERALAGTSGSVNQQRASQAARLRRAQAAARACCPRLRNPGVGAAIVIGPSIGGGPAAPIRPR